MFRAAIEAFYSGLKLETPDRRSRPPVEVWTRDFSVITHPEHIFDDTPDIKVRWEYQIAIDEHIINILQRRCPKLIEELPSVVTTFYMRYHPFDNNVSTLLHNCEQEGNRITLLIYATFDKTKEGWEKCKAVLREIGEMFEEMLSAWIIGLLLSEVISGEAPKSDF